MQWLIMLSLTKKRKGVIDMTLDEAISECKENDLYQIAEWLEELKTYKSLTPRELVSQKQKNDRFVEYSKGFDYGFKTGYKKAIYDFAEKLNEKCDGMINEEWNSNVAAMSWAEAYADFKDDIYDIAEQLKAGVKE